MKSNANPVANDVEGSRVGVLSRRAALTRLAVLPIAAALPVLVPACSRGPKCEDTSGLSADDVKIRTQVAGYVDQSPDVTKYCSACAHYVPAAKDACGTCKVVKGPINPNGTCKLFVARPAT
jgi:hypothetical protein